MIAAAASEGTTTETKSKSGKKKKNVAILKTADDIRLLKLFDDESTKTSSSTSTTTTSTSSVDARLKKLKSLRKKLTDIDQLQKRIETGELEKPEKNQLEKISRRCEIVDEINELEKEISLDDVKS